MFKARQVATVPKDAFAAHDFGPVDYIDCYCVQRKPGEPIEAVAERIFSLPSWVMFLMRAREWIFVKPFGLKPSAARLAQTSGRIPMPVLQRSENEIILGENDAHLNFRVSVLRKRGEGVDEIYLTTVVRFNNRLGRAYFAIIKPVHKHVVKSMLARA